MRAHPAVLERSGCVAAGFESETWQIWADDRWDIQERGWGEGGCVVRDLLQFEGTSRVEHEVDPVEKLLETVATAVQ